MQGYPSQGYSKVGGAEGEASRQGVGCPHSLPDPFRGAGGEASLPGSGVSPENLFSPPYAIMCFKLSSQGKGGKT